MRMPNFLVPFSVLKHFFSSNFVQKLTYWFVLLLMRIWVGSSFGLLWTALILGAPDFQQVYICISVDCTPRSPTAERAALVKTVKHKPERHMRSRVYAPFFRGERPWSWRRAHPGTAALRTSSTVPFPLLFPSIHSDYKYLLSTHCLPGTEPDS